MGCINVHNCTNECCRRSDWRVHRMKCPGCKHVVFVVQGCRTCGHMKAWDTYRDSVQLCGGFRLPCLYVCIRCAGMRLASFGYNQAVVDDSYFNNSDFARRLGRSLGGVGTHFEYVHLSFIDGPTYTIRKPLIAPYWRAPDAETQTKYP